MLTQKIVGIAYGVDNTHMFKEDNLDIFIGSGIAISFWKKYVQKFEEKYNPDAKIWTIHSVCVDKEFYGFGLGKILVLEVINSAREKGVQLLTYEATNLISEGVAKACGFVRESSFIYDEYCERGTQEDIYPLQMVCTIYP